MGWTEPPRDWTTGELVNETIMDTHIRDQFKAVPHILAYKTADETVASSTVLQDDDHLFFSIGANEDWHVVLGIWYNDTSNGTADFQFGVTVPASTTFTLQAVALDLGGSVALRRLNAAAPSTTMFGDNTDRFFELPGVVRTAGTSGTFRFQFAQSTSNASGVIVRRGSYIKGLKLN